MKELELTKKTKKTLAISNKKVAAGVCSPATIKSAASNPIYEQTVASGAELVLPPIQLTQSDGLTQEQIEYGSTITCNVCQTLNELVESSTAVEVADALDAATAPKKEDVKNLICDLMAADFSASKTTAKVNEVISFTPSSSPVADNYAFGFGDQTNSYGNGVAQKSYSMPGTYSVEMLAANTTIGKRVVKNNYITVQGLANLKATYFNGVDQWGTVAHHSDFNFGTGNFTIAMTVMPYSVSGGLRCFMEKMSFSFGTGLWIGQSGSSLQLLINSGSSGLSVPNVFAAMNRYHLLVTRNGGTITTYINGILVGTTTGIPGNTGDNLLFGRHDGASSSFFNGWLDEISIFNEGFSSIEVIEHYNAGDTLYLPGFSKYLSAKSWWRMGDVDNNPIIYDQINGHNITLNNMSNSSFISI